MNTTSDTNHNDHRPQDGLDQHIACLRDVATGSNPPEATVAATLAMLRGNRIPGDEVRGGRLRFLGRMVQMSFAQRVAAAVLVALGGVVLYVMFTLFSGLGTSMAFADVAEKLTGARTLSYVTTVTMGDGKPTVTKTIAAEPDRMRTEMSGGMVVIKSGQTSLMLNTNHKTAMRMELTITSEKPLPVMAGGIVSALRNLGDAKGEPVGEKVIDGIAVKGFRVPIGGQAMTVWADKKTAMPVMIETRMPSALGDSVVVMDQFQIDPPLDEKLFSLEVPEGYKLTTQKLAFEVPSTPEAAVAGLLRGYAERSDGLFPEKLDDWQVYGKMEQAFDPKDKDAQMKFGMARGAAMGTLFGLQQGYGYAGKGVKLGEKDRIVFWFKPKPDSPEYVVLFGDLSTGKATQDKLPATQPPVPIRR